MKCFWVNNIESQHVLEHCSKWYSNFKIPHLSIMPQAIYLQIGYGGFSYKKIFTKLYLMRTSLSVG